MTKTLNGLNDTGEGFLRELKSTRYAENIFALSGIMYVN